MANDTNEFPGLREEGADLRRVPLSGTRAQAIQRLQVGAFGLAAMILLVGLANIVISNANENDARVVPEATPAVETTRTATSASDPLADAGVVPDIRAAPATNGAAQPEAVDALDLEAP